MDGVAVSCPSPRVAAARLSQSGASGGHSREGVPGLGGLLVGDGAFPSASAIGSLFFFPMFYLIEIKKNSCLIYLPAFKALRVERMGEKLVKFLKVFTLPTIADIGSSNPASVTCKLFK